ncbi:MAG: holin [Clostridiales bacterium]|jgi:toxin secretion/phage lysis holin|nr:holin [Clostridiales bacterium]
MDKIIKLLQGGAVAIGGALGYILGGFDGLLWALLAFVILDYVTGVLVAIARKELSSEIGFIGISKKVFIFILVAIANIIDVNILGTGSAVRTATILFYCSNEGISILENAINLGLKVPKKLRDILIQINNDDNGE